jgi:hypothetical protein
LQDIALRKARFALAAAQVTEMAASMQKTPASGTPAAAFIRRMASRMAAHHKSFFMKTRGAENFFRALF